MFWMYRSNAVSSARNFIEQIVTLITPYISDANSTGSDGKMRVPVLLLAFAGSVSTTVIQTSLTKIETRRSHLLRLGLLEEYLKAKDVYRSTLASVPQTVTDYDDLGFPSEFLIAQSILATSPSARLVSRFASSSTRAPPISGCRMSFACNFKFSRFVFRSASCAGKKKFNSGSSASYEHNGAPWIIQYGSGDAGGVLGVDTVRVCH